MSLFWYGFAGGLAGSLASANPAVIIHAIEGACALVESTWPEGALDPDAAGYALSELYRLGLPSDRLLAATAGIGEPGTPDSVAEGLDVVTYANSTVLGSVTQVAASSSTKSGESIEVYGLERLSKTGASYVTDGRGSVAQELSSSGTVSSWHSWGTFGGQESGSALGELPSYGYNGEEAHPQTGLQYLRARYYDASVGRFEAQDSYLGTTLSPLSLNRYLYCLSEPMNLIDPSGYAANWTRLYNPFTVSAYDRHQSFKASIGVPTGGQIYVTVPIGGVWRVTETMARLTTYAGLANWAAIAAQRPGYGTPSGYSGSMSYAEWARWKALQLQMEVRRVYCGSAEKLADYKTRKAEEEKQRNEALHGALDVLGFVPVVGAITDGVNALWYLAEGNITEAVMSGISAIPGGGDAVGGISMARRSFYVINKSEAAADAGKVFKKKSGLSGKEAANDIPSWARGEAPYVGESGEEFARRLLDTKYGPGNYPIGSNTEYSQLHKYGDRAFE